MGMIFLELLNRSIAAGWLILAVLILRLLMKKAPGWLTCALWAIVAVRLVCPFSLESAFSLIPSAETLSPYMVRYAPGPAIDSGISSIDHALNPVITGTFAPEPGASVNPLDVWFFLAGIVWAAGSVFLLGLALIRFLQIRRRVSEAIPFRENIWLCDAIPSPFILGIIRPRIYLPSGMDETQTASVLAHEQAHLQRKDHWWKPLGWLLLAIYWFHPLMWAAYLLLCRDIELACDEKVIRDMTIDEKKAYSHALVSLSLQRRMVLACPLAFGETSVKTRVKAVLHYKKPAFWVILAASAACVLTAVCFLTDPPTDISDIPAGSKAPIYDTAEELSPAGNQVTLYAGDGLEDADTEPSDSKSFTQRYEALHDRTSALEQAVTAAILQHNVSSYPDDYDLACCDFAMLESVSSPPADESSTNTITVYGWALYQKYRILDTGIEDVGGSHIPVALTFTEKEEEYILREYWEPRDGSYFVEDIREKFPDHLAADGIDSQKFGLAQIQNCYRQAVLFGGLDTDSIVDRLLNTICSGPGASSAPQDYLHAHTLEYRELLYYGEYTLRRCFGRFSEGNETGLEGRIMAIVCEELLQTKGTVPADAGTAETGQFWYDTLYAHAGNQVEPYLP